MVFRKPYAFLIKNFKKIHILLVVLWGFIYYHLFKTRGFLKEFVQFGTYNKNLEGISTMITPSLYISMILMVIISILMFFLLRHKKKPSKLYLVVILEYILAIYTCASLTNFFNSYTNNNMVSEVFIYRDLLNIVGIIQYVVLIILLIRITGLDLNKFSFNTDEEFLELSSKDREEFEINIEIDKYSFKRKFNLYKRRLNYFYQEHKFVCNLAIIGIFLFTVGYSYYYFGILHKSYKQGDVFNAGIYSIKVNECYVTNKDTSGNIVEKNNKFVILSITMRNNSNDKVEPNYNRFHLMNKNINRTNTLYYDSYFSDLGSSTTSFTNILGGKSKTFNLVYKVDDKLDNNKFILYYQEYNGFNNTYLRKIKLKVHDISNIGRTINKKIGDKISFSIMSGDKHDVVFEDINISPTSSYYKYSCNDNTSCSILEKQLVVDNGFQVLKVTFSGNYDGEKFIDFSSSYGRIKYIDSKGRIMYSKIDNAVMSDYEGKEMFIKISNEIASSKEIYLEYILRDKKYVIRLK